MSSKSDHLKYIHDSGEFTIDVSKAIFTKEEIELLQNFGYWYEALTLGYIDPISVQQEKFIECTKGERNPVTKHELVWFKYLGRKRLESEEPEKFKLNYQSKEDGFYTRNQFKQMKSMMGSEMNKNHRK